MRGRDAVVQDDAVVGAPDGDGAAQRLDAARRAPGRVREQRRHAVEVSQVETFGVLHDQRRDGLHVRRHDAPILRRARARLQGAGSAMLARMRIGVALPNYGALAGRDTLARLARLAEDCDADGVWVSDHLVAPVGATSVYPYGSRRAPTSSQLGIIEEFYEPLVTLAFLAGQTRRVRLGVSAYVMPYRNPVVTAQQIATLDALSGGRVVLAVGVGWLREEFDALDVPFARRGRRTDDYLAVCRALWAGGVATYDGTDYRLPPVRSGPQPAQRPHPPIWIAGNSDAA